MKPENNMARYSCKTLEDKKDCLGYLYYIMGDKFELTEILVYPEDIRTSIYEQIMQIQKYRVMPKLLLVNDISLDVISKMNDYWSEDKEKFMGLKVIEIDTIGDWLVEVR